MGKMGSSNQAHAVSYRHGWPTISKLKDVIHGYYRLLDWFYANEEAAQKYPWFKSMREKALQDGRDMVQSINHAYGALARVRRTCHENNQLTLRLEE